MRLIDADKLPITNTYALVNSKDVKPNEISFAPLVCVLKSDIDKAPTVEPTTVYEFKGCDNCELERPKGKWIEYDDDGLYAGECSCCKWKAVLYESNVLNMNFCPNCGARMESKE